MKKISVLLFLSLLVVSITPLVQGTDTKIVNQAVTSNNANSDALPNIPLTDNEINSKWPDLPNVKELFNSGHCLYIDLRYAGKQVTSLDDALPDPDCKADVNVSSWIVNCTREEIDWRNGGIIKTNQIWLRYNTSIWILVPQKYLVNPRQELIQQTDGTWALGLYTDPDDIANGAPVMGAVTFGEWPTTTWTSTDSSKYLGTDVLSVCDTDDWEYQWVMVTRPGWGNHLSLNIWDPYGYVTPYSFSCPSGSVQGQLYNLYIKYNDNLNRWEFWWNFYLISSWSSSASTITVGNQPNICVESNDLDQTDFTSFRTRIGGTYYYGGVTYTLPAIGFLYWGQWVPSNPGDPIPAAFAYLGGTVMPGWPGIGVGTTNPSSLGWTDWGETWAYPEQLLVGYDYPMPYQGKSLWPHQN